MDFQPQQHGVRENNKLNKVYNGTEKMQLRVRRSSLKPQKTRETPERPEQVIWMFNRSMQHCRDDYKVEDDIWVGMVKNKQSSKIHPELVTVDNPRKR